MGNIFKSLGLVKDNSKESNVTPIEELKKQSNTIVFPSSPKYSETLNSTESIVPEFSVKNTDSLEQDNPYLEQVRKMYQDGFTKLNKPSKS